MRTTPKPVGNARPVASIERIRSLLRYVKSTGLLYWKRNGALAGSKYTTGYIVVMIDYRAYPAHRLAWAIIKGEWPKNQIDHRNNVRDDNRWSNLRTATRSQNQHNKLGSGATGIKGVSFCKREGRFIAGISINGKRKHLGYFDTAEEGGSAYKKASEERFGAFSSICHRNAVRN